MKRRILDEILFFLFFIFRGKLKNFIDGEKCGFDPGFVVIGINYLPRHLILVCGGSESIIAVWRCGGVVVW